MFLFFLLPKIKTFFKGIWLLETNMNKWKMFLRIKESFSVKKNVKLNSII